MSASPMRCAMTGMEIRDSGDGIWEEGEWISLVWIGTHIKTQENARASFKELGKRIQGEKNIEIPFEPTPELSLLIIEAIVSQQSLLWGAVGELYVKETFGVRLSRPNTQGHDGHRNKDVIEINTITAHKRRPDVRVKRTGNFNVLAVVRVTDDFRFEARFIRRGQLPLGSGGKYMIVSWTDACRLGTMRPD